MVHTKRRKSSLPGNANFFDQRILPQRPASMAVIHCFYLLLHFLSPSLIAQRCSSFAKSYPSLRRVENKVPARVRLVLTSLTLSPNSLVHDENKITSVPHDRTNVHAIAMATSWFNIWTFVAFPGSPVALACPQDWINRTCLQRRRSNSAPMVGRRLRWTRRNASSESSIAED